MEDAMVTNVPCLQINISEFATLPGLVLLNKYHVSCIKRCGIQRLLSIVKAVTRYDRQALQYSLLIYLVGINYKVVSIFIHVSYIF